MEFEISSTGESRERVNFRVPRELWNEIKRHEVLEKDLARFEGWATEPTRTDCLVLLLKIGLAARQEALRARRDAMLAHKLQENRKQDPRLYDNAV